MMCLIPENRLVWFDVVSFKLLKIPHDERALLIVQRVSEDGEPNFALLVANAEADGWLRCDTLEAPDDEFWQSVTHYTWTTRMDP